MQRGLHVIVLFFYLDDFYMFVLCHYLDYLYCVIIWIVCIVSLSGLSVLCHYLDYLYCVIIWIICIVSLSGLSVLCHLRTVEKDLKDTNLVSPIHI